MIKAIIRILFPHILKCYSDVDATFAQAWGLPGDWQINSQFSSCVYDKHKSQQVLQWRIRDPVVIQRACGISAVRANKGGSSLEGLFGAPTVWSVLGRQLSHFCAAAGESLRKGGGLLCTVFSAHPLPLSLFAGHLRAQSSGAVSWLIILGWDGIFIPRAGLEQSWPWTLAFSGQEPWADCADHALYLCGGYRGVLAPI